MADNTDSYKTDEMKRIFLNTLGKEECLGNVTIALKRTGYCRDTMYKYKAQDAKFCLAWDDTVLKCKEKRADLAEDGLVKLVEKLNVTAIIFTLKNLRPEVWKDRTDSDKVKNDGKFNDITQYREFCERNKLDPETGLRIIASTNTMVQEN